MLERDADRLDRHAGADSAHHGGGIDIGHRTGLVGNELGNGGRAAALRDLDVEPFLFVEALVTGDEERRVLAVKRPVQAEREICPASARRRAPPV